MFVHYTPGSLERAEAFLIDFFSPDESQWFDYSPYAAYPHLCPYWYSSAFDHRDYHPQLVPKGKVPFGKGPIKMGHKGPNNMQRQLGSPAPTQARADMRNMPAAHEWQNRHLLGIPRLHKLVERDPQDDVQGTHPRRGHLDESLQRFDQGHPPERTDGMRFQPRGFPFQRQIANVRTQADDPKGLGTAIVTGTNEAHLNDVVDDDADVEPDNDVAMGKAFVHFTDQDESDASRIGMIDSLIDVSHHQSHHQLTPEMSGRRSIKKGYLSVQADHKLGKKGVTIGPPQPVITYVGRIETFNKSLTALGRIANVTFPQPNASKKHESGLDMVARLEKNAMLAFLERSPQWTARLAQR